MINYNLLIYEILDRKFQINYWDVNYAEGDLAELSKKLELSETKYPIIWLQPLSSNCPFFSTTR